MPTRNEQKKNARQAAKQAATTVVERKSPAPFEQPLAAVDRRVLAQVETVDQEKDGAISLNLDQWVTALAKKISQQGVSSKCGMPFKDDMLQVRKDVESSVAKARNDANRKKHLHENLVEAICKRVKAIGSSWAGAEVRLFGSRATEFYLETSDVDVVIKVPESLHGRSAKGLLHEVDRALRPCAEEAKAPEGGVINKIKYKAAEVQKMFDDAATGVTFNLDISVDSAEGQSTSAHTGLRMVALTEQLTKQLPALKERIADTRNSHRHPHQSQTLPDTISAMCCMRPSLSRCHVLMCPPTLDAWARHEACARGPAGQTEAIIKRVRADGCRLPVEPAGRNAVA